MKRYDVYGLGSAIVDTEIEVSDADLNALGIEKGLMTLVDENRQSELLDKLSSHLTLSKRACGGSAANTIIALSQFGGKGCMACKLADDDNGRFYRQDLIHHNVDYSGSKHLDSGITGKCLVMITSDAERTMNTFLGIAAQLGPDDIDLTAIAESEYIYIEGYLVTSNSGRAAAIKARQTAQGSGTKVAISLSDPGIVAHFRDGLNEIVGSGVDLLFCNKQEALSWCDTDNLKAAIKTMQHRAKQFVITLGADGAVVFDGDQDYHVSAQPVTAVDTNGAGDMFAGAYLYAINDGQSPVDAARLATRAASAVVGTYGPRLQRTEYNGLKNG
jgi:sugar/nucleoside kinase (ribokinase family)